MCGIAGFIDGDGTRAGRAARLSAMTDAIEHRGPDGAGHYVDDRMAMGMRRLAIIDLAGGDQPIWNEDQTVAVVFNGEIYNYRELRSELVAKGHRFTTGSDTEVIVHLFEEEGVACFARFNGMCAAAIYDRRDNTLTLGRDRYGKKPLFIADVPGAGLMFASEVKALVAGGLRPQIDPTMLSTYLALECVPTPKSLIKHVRKLEAGHTCKIDLATGATRTVPYSSANHELLENPPTFAEATEELRRRLALAVERRLVADVPLGVFLSGGIDSSVVAALATRASSSTVRTFSIGFAEASFDESAHARLVAQDLGTDHHEGVLEADTMLDLVPRIADLLDEPVADPSILPTFLLSRFTRQHVTVALGGDGGDEVFAGYPTYTAHRQIGRYQRIPSLLRAGLIEPAVRRLPASDDNFSFEFKAKRFISGAGESLERRHAIWMSANDPRDSSSLVSIDLRQEQADPFAHVDHVSSAMGTDDWVHRILSQDFSRYMRDVVLVKVDRASMAASLEVRAPMLDPEIVTWASQLPGDYHFDRTTKRLLKAASRGLIPDDIIDRPKKGFGVPLARWLRGPLAPIVEELLSPAAIARSGLLDEVAVGRILREHMSGKRDNRKQLWPIIVLRLWQERWETAGR